MLFNGVFCTKASCLAVIVQVLNRCFWYCDVNSECHDFTISIEVNGEKMQMLKNVYLTRLQI